LGHPVHFSSAKILRQRGLTDRAATGNELSTDLHHWRHLQKHRKQKNMSTLTP